MVNKKKRDLNVVDLFSGIGGLHMGFEKEGFNILLSSDFDERCSKTHEKNFSHIPFLHEDVKKVRLTDIKKIVGNKKIDIVIGGPPCQGFSTIGKRASSDEEKRKKKDPRNYLFMEFVRLVKELNPEYFLMENVKGMLTMRDEKGLFIDKIIRSFKRAGYKDIDYKLVDSADYGVPQHRKRVIILGNRIGKKITFPKKTHSKNGENGLKKYVTVGDTIMDIAKKTGKIPNHEPLNHGWKNIERYKLIPEGERMPEDKLPQEIYRKNFGNTFKRLDREKPSLTMVPGHSAFPIHPTENRSLTVREAARLQTIPDEMVFVGNRTQQGMQVGNAVPVKLAEVFAKHLKKEMKDNGQK